MEVKIIIDGVETDYSVSEEGIIKNMKTGRIMTINNGNVQLYINGKHYGRSVGKIVAEAFLEKPNEKCLVNHKDGNRMNNRVENLEWITNQQNVNNIWEKRRANNTTNAGKTLVKKKQENIVEANNYVLQNDEKQIELDGELIPYSISKDGKVRNLKTNRFLSGSILHSYRYINFRWEGKQKNKSVHQLVALAFLDNPNHYTIVDHINGDRLDNRVENLRWVSAKENMKKASEETNAWGFREVGEFDEEGNMLRKFANASAAARAIGILPGSMRNSIRRNGKCYNGLRYKYLEE